MQEITLKANAKINISLDVIGKRADGYHEVRMVMQQIDLFDLVTIGYSPLTSEEMDRDQVRQKGPKISLTTNNPDLPTDSANIAYGAATLMAQTCADLGLTKEGRIKIHIDKRIPVAAGLAGGSTDAAAVLLALNALWSLDYSLEELMILGQKLGADVPFCIMGNAARKNREAKDGWGIVKADDKRSTFGSCALAEGIGEKLTPIGKADGSPLTVFEDCWIVLSKPGVSIFTAKIYVGLVLSDIKTRPDSEELIRGLTENNWTKISKNMINVLENVTLKEYGIVTYTKNKMLACDPIVALMSGSGPSIFGIFVDKSAAEKAYDVMKEISKETYLIQTL